MSMSDFERQLNAWEEGNDKPSRFSQQGLDLPDDFSTEDVAFAQELESLFAPDKEEIPPYFVQTLLEAEDARFQPVEQKFEQKTSARVFRRLNIRRRLFRRNRPSLRSLIDPLQIKRPYISLMASCLCFMMLTMLATSCSFASGLNILLAGTHSGVVQVPGYPSITANATIKHHSKQLLVDPPQPQQIALSAAQQQLHFPMYWPTSMPTNYTLDEIYLHPNTDQSWADGPILELSYDYTGHGLIPHGTGQIVICEFRPNGQVYQAVQAGAAHQVQVSKDPYTHAVYVDGQWVRINRYSHNWMYGARSEIIYEQNGIIFWIVGDQRDGIDQAQLLKIATSLQVFDVSRAMHTGAASNSVTVPLNTSSWLFSEDVVYSDTVDGSLWYSVGNTSTTVGVSAEKGGAHSH